MLIARVAWTRLVTKENAMAKYCGTTKKTGATKAKKTAKETKKKAAKK
jgi:hypothetical protein